MSAQNSIRSRENHPRTRAFMHRKRTEQYPRAEMRSREDGAE